ncbi:MAG: cob(I)yrinic acid a,c-diamide adenosyltransferase [Thermoproteota archaeon]|nr:cob(I)yrinic acid a,c-diamide adenosyltransferase [Thermoproteota archaeon]
MKIYTKTGDKGNTGLAGGTRVSKSNPRIMAYGQIDELNANLGLAVAILSEEAANKVLSDIIEVLLSIQNDLFIVGSDLADPDYRPSVNSKTPRVGQDMVTRIENNIDNLESELDPISYFILPGGTSESSILHVCRSVARRAEVSVVSLANSNTINETLLVYINRLSDLLFVLARTVNKRKNIKDVAWRSTNTTS